MQKQFDKTAIRERMELYTALAKAIWNPEIIKELAGGWDDAVELTIESGNGRPVTVEYGYRRSWEDTRKWGFVSAYSGSYNLLSNINVGDFVFCHIAGVGFVGVVVFAHPRHNLQLLSWLMTMEPAAPH